MNVCMWLLFTFLTVHWNYSVYFFYFSNCSWGIRTKAYSSLCPRTEPMHSMSTGYWLRNKQVWWRMEPRIAKTLHFHTILFLIHSLYLASVTSSSHDFLSSSWAIPLLSHLIAILPILHPTLSNLEDPQSSSPLFITFSIPFLNHLNGVPRWLRQ